MNWFWQKGKGEPAPELKYSEAGPVSTAFTANRPAWTPREYERLAEEAFLRNAVSFRCVKLIATCVSTIPIMLMRGEDEVDSHAILDLLNVPSPMTSRQQLFEAMTAYLLLSGNSYLEAVGAKNGPPKELWPLRPDRMKVIPSVYGTPSGFRYEIGGRKKDWPANPVTRESPILHIKEFHPINDNYGMSRTEPAAYGIDRHNAASAHNKALLDNGARPTGALVFKPTKVGNDEYEQAPQTLIDAAISKLNDLRTGARNAGKPLVLGGDVSWEEMAVTPRDMDFNEGKLDAARDICYSYGVPPILVVPGESTYNNRSEAKLELYEETVIPLAISILDMLSVWLNSKFKETGLRIVPDLDSVSALEPRREKKRESTISLLESNVIDINEAREALQYGARDDMSLTASVDSSVLTALISAAREDDMMYQPLWRYMRSVGLVDQKLTFAQWLAQAMSETAEENTVEQQGESPAGTEEGNIEDERDQIQE